MTADDIWDLSPGSRNVERNSRSGDGSRHGPGLTGAAHRASTTGSSNPEGQILNVLIEKIGLRVRVGNCAV